jgi:hypothetical protein
MTITEVAMRRLRDPAEMSGVVLELAARWMRQEDRRVKFAAGTYGGERHTDHDSGRMEGYVQAIALLLGLAVSETRTMLQRGLFRSPTGDVDNSPTT